LKFGWLDKILPQPTNRIFAWAKVLYSYFVEPRTLGTDMVRMLLDAIGGN
jgi:hypothetical protein